jgi:hypothetical protein
MADEKNANIVLEHVGETVSFSQKVKGKDAEEIIDLLNFEMSTSDGIAHLLDTTDSLEAALAELRNGGFTGVVIRKSTTDMRLFYTLKDYGTVAKQLSEDEAHRFKESVGNRDPEKYKNVFPLKHAEILWILYALDASNPMVARLSAMPH